MQPSKSTDKLTLLTELAKTALPHLRTFREVEVTLRWTRMWDGAAYILLPEINVELHQ